MDNSPINTKTRSNSSSISTFVLAGLQKQPTDNDIMKVTTDLEKSQSEILSAIFNITKLQTSQFS